VRGICFGSLAVCFRSQTGCVAYWSFATFFSFSGEAAALGQGLEAVPRIVLECMSSVLQLTKIMEKLSQVNLTTVGCSAPKVILFVEFSIAGDGLH